MLARHGQRLSPCSLFVLACQACSHRRNEVEYFGDWLWITFLESRGATPWKAMIWRTVAVVPAIPTHFPHAPVRHPELVSGSYFPRRNSKILKQVQDDGVRDDGGRDDRAVGMRAAHLRAFVPLCEIHWRSVWFLRGCALALWARAQPARPFALSGVYRTCHRNSIERMARNKSRFICCNPET